MNQPSFSMMQPCRCSASNEPHYHVDLFTIIPWARFQASMEEYFEREGISRTSCSEQPIIRRGTKDEPTS